MALLFTSFIAGILTIAAPCVLPLLPVIIGSSVPGSNRKKPYIIILSLSISLVIFTLLLKATSLLLGVDTMVWAVISGSIVLVFGIITLFPGLWDKVSKKLKLTSSSHALLQSSSRKKGYLGDIMMGSALGPVFSSCSPTYALIVATVLPQSFLVGLVNVIVYVLGLAIVLLLIAVFGQRIVSKLSWLADPHSKFKKVLGIIFIVVGLLIITGFDKNIQTYLIESGIYKVSELELKLLGEM